MLGLKDFLVNAAKPMTYTKNDTTTLNLKTTEDYLNRELSWLAFNYRVLHEGIDERTPLLEP